MNRTQLGRRGDRAEAVIRPARPADPAEAAALGDFFSGLSAWTRYLRFFAPVTPGPALLDLLSGRADHVDALVAVVEGAVVGHAMASDQADPGGSRVTDIGVVAAEAWQGRGLGSALVRTLLARAQARGVTSVAMEVLPENYRVIAMIKGHWPAARIVAAREYTAISVPLPPAANAGRRSG